MKFGCLSVRGYLEDSMALYILMPTYSNTTLTRHSSSTKLSTTTEPLVINVLKAMRIVTVLTSDLGSNLHLYQA